ncbi:MAG: glycosyltransferase [bacterium]
MGKISIIIPTYNRKAKIIRAIDSVLSQTVKPYEILICDDGSDDGTEMLVRQIRNTRIKWVPGKHTGLPAVPRNRGVQLAKGDWIAFLDSDDWWKEDKLEKQLIFAKQNKLLAMCSNAFLIRKQNNFGKLLNFSKNVIAFTDLLDTNFVICSSAIIHRSLFKKCEGFPEDPSLKAIEDYALWLRIATQTYFGYVREPLVYYNDDIHSVRTKGPQTLIEQKEIVYNNFLLWIKHKNNLTNYRKKVDTALSYLYP